MTNRRIEELDRARRRMLVGFVAAFVAWQLPTVLDEILAGHLPGAYNAVLSIVAAAAGLVWIVFAVRMYRTARAIARDPSAAEALDDERVRVNRGRSFAVGFWTLLGFLVATRLLAFGWELSSSAVAQVGIILAVAAPIVTFLVLERE